MGITVVVLLHVVGNKCFKVQFTSMYLAHGKDDWPLAHGCICAPLRQMTKEKGHQLRT